MPWEAGTIALGSLLLCIAPVRRYRSLLLASFAALLLSVGCMTGCGGGGSASGGGSGGGSGTTTIPGTTADTYTVTFRAVDVATGTVTAQDYFNFSVN